MKLFEFLELTYIKVNIELQKEYTAAKHGETLAIQALIQANRTAHKWLAYPKLLISYLLTSIGLLEAPKTRLQQQEELNNHAAEKAAQNTLTLAANQEVPANSEQEV